MGVLGWQWHYLYRVQTICTSLQTDNNTIQNDTRCYFNVRSKADMTQLNLPHGNANTLSLNFYRRPDAVLTPSQQCQSTHGSNNFCKVNCLCCTVLSRNILWIREMVRVKT